MKSLVLTPLKSHNQNKMNIRTCKIDRYSDNEITDSREIFFALPEDIELPEDNDCDSYLLAMLMDGMQEKRKIIVKGSVSGTLLSNLTEYQGIWDKWIPGLYNKTEIIPDKIRERDRMNNSVLCAFSGGVDSTFSVWKNTIQKNVYQKYKISFGAFIHGTDIPLSCKKEFQNAFNTASRTLESLNIPLFPVCTNYKEISDVEWEHSHASAIIATLSNFKKVAGTIILASSLPYNRLITPWGSNPISDHWLSSGDFHVIHDGADYNRTEKIREISNWKEAMKNLRVCWIGDLKDRNCGKCEKCTRTKIAFLANGLPIPECFPEPKEKLHFKNIHLHNDSVRSNWQEILEIALENGIKDKWVCQTKKVLNRRKLKDVIFPEGSIHRKIAKNFIYYIHQRYIDDTTFITNFKENNR